MLDLSNTNPIDPMFMRNTAKSMTSTFFEQERLMFEANPNGFLVTKERLVSRFVELGFVPEFKSTGDAMNDSLVHKGIRAVADMVRMQISDHAQTPNMRLRFMIAPTNRKRCVAIYCGASLAIKEELGLMSVSPQIARRKKHEGRITRASKLEGDDARAYRARTRNDVLNILGTSLVEMSARNFDQALLNRARGLCPQILQTWPKVEGEMVRKAVGIETIKNMEIDFGKYHPK
jgi:hypothetical protein